MKFKRTLKRFVSLTPKWLFNFYISFIRRKKHNIDNEQLEMFYPDSGHSSLKPTRVFSNAKYDLKIIIPCFNVAKYIEECIESILKQKAKYNFVVALVNDGSTDETLKILKRYQSDKIIVINKENGGSASARNKALEIVESEFVMFIDSDDCFLGDGVLDHCLDIAYEAKNECKGKLIVEFKHSNSFTSPSYKVGLKRTKYTNLSGFAWAKVFSTSLFDNVNFPEGYWFEDTVLSTIVYPQADLCFLNRSRVYFYRPTENSMTIKGTKANKTIDTFYVTKQLLSDRRNLGLCEDYNYYYRFYMQTICNAVRVKNLPKNIQMKVFLETIQLLNQYSIKQIYMFRELYKSLISENFEKYSRFCFSYSKMYLNL